jgi:hypothetical protein
MVIEFLNGHGNVVQALPCMTFAGKYVTVPVALAMLRYYCATEDFTGFRFRIGSARTSVVMVL